MSNSWEKRWNWADRYYKGNMMVYPIYAYPNANKILHWHLEECVDTHKYQHHGNYPTFEAACAAGDKILSSKRSKSV